LKKFLLIFITLLVSLGYLFITDKKIDMNQSILGQTSDNDAEKKLQTDLASLKQKVLVPVENRNSYLLNEQKISTYKSTPNDVNSIQANDSKNAATKISATKKNTKKVYKSRWKK